MPIWWPTASWASLPKPHWPHWPPAWKPKPPCPILPPAHRKHPSPSAETLQLASSSHEEIDAELLAIFIEEGKEVLGELAQQKARLRTNA